MSIIDEQNVVEEVIMIVDGAIHKAAGELLIEENKTHGGCKNGEAKLSCGYRLPAKCKQNIMIYWRQQVSQIIPDIISVVGPRGEKPDLLSLSYTNCLNLLVSAGLRTIVSTLVQHSMFFILCPGIPLHLYRSVWVPC